MNGRNNKFLVPVATVVLMASLIGLAISIKQLFFSSNHQVAGSVGGNATSNAISTGPVNSVNHANANGQENRQAIARNNPANKRANSPPAYSIFHPPPVVSYPLHGILNSKLSYPVHFVMAMAACPGGQTIAMATEGQGLVMFRPDARPPHRWVQFHPEKAGGGFPSWNTYSVCFDSQGRLWVGTLRKGVVVGFIGRSGWQWRHYDEICRPASAKDPNFPNEGGMTFNGPIGSHVFAITENPVDHSVWLSTEAGISVYYPRGAKRKDADLRGVHKAAGLAGGTAPMLFGRWRYITQANGLPSSPVDCIAFDKTGRIFAGTQCNGIAIATMQDNYQHWRIVKGPDHVTLHGTGNGLPSDLINAILVTKQSKIYVATDWGLGISDDDGQSWHYIRGQDYAAKVAQLWHPPKHWQQPSPQSLSHLLPGDHVTALAQDFSGRIYLGTWRNGYAIYQSGKGIIYHNTLPKGLWRHGGDYVNAILPVHLDRQDSEGLGGPTKVVLVGQYGAIAHPKSSAVSIAWEGGQTAAKRINERQPNTRFPEAAVPPTRDQLAEMLHQIQSTKLNPIKPGQVVALPADWRTEGNWEGNYGKYWMCLYDFGGGGGTLANLIWSPGPIGLDSRIFIGPHHRPGDALRNWIQKPFAGKRSLMIPDLYFRILEGTGYARSTDSPHREAEVDDHGESYPTAWQGPDVEATLRLPSGCFFISIYEINADGHDGLNRQRDYNVEARTLARGAYGRIDRSPLGSDPRNWRHRTRTSPASVARFPRGSLSSRERDSALYPGVWNRFAVRGPATLEVSIQRNHSLNATLPGIALDRVNEHPDPYYYGSAAWKRRIKAQAKRRANLRKAWQLRDSNSTLGLGPWQLVATLREDEEFLMYSAPQTWAGNQVKIYAALLRWTNAHDQPPQLLPAAARAEYRLALFNRWSHTEHELGIKTPAQVDAALKWNGINTDYRGTEYGVIRREIDGATTGQHKPCGK